MAEKGDFHNQLKGLMDGFVLDVYSVTRNFPKEEMYGLTSQIRRSSLSVILNYIEGFARQRKAVLKNFLEISYGSLKETKYLIYFSGRQNYLSKTDEDKLLEKSERVGRMLWGIISKL
jgi:four helix bundle protein